MLNIIGRSLIEPSDNFYLYVYELPRFRYYLEDVSGTQVRICLYYCDNNEQQYPFLLILLQYCVKNECDSIRIMIVLCCMLF